jgi:hypothetical protein
MSHADCPVLPHVWGVEGGITMTKIVNEMVGLAAVFHIVGMVALVMWVILDLTGG